MHPLFSIAPAAITASLVSAAHAQSRYDNPVDKKIYETSGEFKTYQPNVPRETRGQRVTTQGVMLLTGEPDLKLRVKVEDLAAYIRAAEVLAYSELAKNNAAMVALVQFNCQPGKCEVKMASQGQAEERTLQGLYDVLSKLAPLKATGKVIFQVTFDVGS